MVMVSWKLKVTVVGTVGVVLTAELRLGVCVGAEF